jgi:predicted nucleic acid-binding protein
MKTKISFWDTSAIVPLCYHQQSSLTASRLVRQYPRIVIWWGTPIETRSAFWRLHREGEITETLLQYAIKRLRALRGSWSEILPTEQVRDLAESVLDGYSLHTGDALQLAAALVWCSEKPRSRAFVCFDEKLALAAEKAGFQVLS